MGKLTISMVIFHSYVSLPEGIHSFNMFQYVSMPTIQTLQPTLEKTASFEVQSAVRSNLGVLNSVTSQLELDVDGILDGFVDEIMKLIMNHCENDEHQHTSTYINIHQHTSTKSN